MDWFQFAVTILTPILQSTVKNPKSQANELHVLLQLQASVNAAVAAVQASLPPSVVPGA